MKTITPFQALRDKPYAIVKSKDGEIYDLYRNKDEAERIARDLNARYGVDSYYAAAIDFVRP